MLSRAKQWFKLHKMAAWILCTLLLFPIIIGFIYALPIPQIVAVDSGDLLSYYAIAFGLAGTAFAYFENQRSLEISASKNAVPRVSVEIHKNEDSFDICIKNDGKSNIKSIDLFDVDLHASLFPGEIIKRKIVFSKGIQSREIVYIWEVEGLEQGPDGYPSYVQLVVFDSMNRGWVLDYTLFASECRPIYSLSSAVCEVF